MNKYRITNPNNNIVRDCKSRTTNNLPQEKGGNLFLDANTNEPFISEAMPGPMMKEGESGASIDLTKLKNPDDYQRIGSNVSTFHSHFEGLEQKPSEGDYNNAAKRTTFKGPHYLFNLKAKNVMLYNGQRKSPITTIPIDQFRTLEGNGKIE